MIHRSWFPALIWLVFFALANVAMFVLYLWSTEPEPRVKLTLMYSEFLSRDTGEVMRENEVYDDLSWGENP